MISLGVEDSNTKTSQVFLVDVEADALTIGGGAKVALGFKSFLASRSTKFTAKTIITKGAYGFCNHVKNF